MSEFEWCTRSRIGVRSELGRSVKCVKCENMSVSVCRGCTNLSTGRQIKGWEGKEDKQRQRGYGAERRKAVEKDLKNNKQSKKSHDVSRSVTEIRDITDCV